jgi:hypothetical protein
VPQARSSGSSSGSTPRRSQTKRSSASKSTGAKRTTRKSASKSTSKSTSKSSGSSARTRAARTTASASSSAGARSNGTAAVDPRLEAVAQRVRKLNERIIEESKSAGEATLTAYEKALRAIATSLERGPGKSDVEWVSSLATTQAKWIRDVTAAWTSAARGMLK